MRRLLGPLVLLLAAGSAAGDSVAFPERVVQFSADNDAYVIVRQNEGIAQMSVHRTAYGVPAPEPERDRLRKGGAAPSGHERVGERVLDGYVGRLFVGSRGDVVVCVRENIESSTPDEAATVVEIHGFDPVVNQGVFLAGLLSAEERGALPRTFSFVSWYSCAWLDVKSGHCIVLGAGTRAWAIGLRDGKVDDVTDAQLTAALRRDFDLESLFALGTLLGRDREDASTMLRDLAADDTVAPAPRFHVLAELAAAGADEAELADLLPPRFAPWARLHVLAWLSSHPQYPVPIPRERRLGALRVLGMAHRTKADLSVMLHAASDPDDAHAAAAVTALTRRECPTLRKELRELLVEQPRHTRALALYYAEFRDAAVVVPLVDALARADAADDDETADALVGALRKQTGIDAGRNADGWRRWLER